MVPTSLLYRPLLTRFILGITLLCATLAWGGWVFLHTVGDPHRAERIATSILASPDARAEIAAPFTDQLVNGAPLDAASQVELRSVVSDVLADPRIVSNFVAAFGSAQANALGVADPRPSVIDVGQLVEVVREHVAVKYPELAAQIPASTQQVEIPKVQSPAVAKARDIADTWTILLGLFALASLVTLMIFGERRIVLRSFGIWAILTGFFYAIGPRLVPALVKSYAPQVDGIVKAMVEALAPQVTTMATILVVAGIAAFVVRAIFFGRGHVQQPRGARVAGAAYDPNSSGGPYQAAPMPRPLAPTRSTYGYAPAEQATAVWVAQPPAAPAWVPEPTSHVAQPAPILLRPLDLPTSSDALSQLTNPD